MVEYWKTACFFERVEWPVIKVSGDECIDWLNRITSQKFINRSDNEIVFGAFLNGKAGVFGLFNAWIRNQNQVLMFIEPQAKASILAYLEEAHFGEDIEFEVIQQDWKCFELCGEEISSKLDMLSVVNNTACNHKLLGAETTILNISDSYMNRYLCLTADENKFRSGIQVLQIIELDYKNYEYLKAYLACPKDQVDLNIDHILIEAKMDKYYHDNKGCYPGQEVINKINSIGKVPKKIASFISHENLKLISIGEEILLNGKKVGSISSVYNCGSLETIAVGSILRNQLDKLEGNEIFSIHGKEFQILNY